jgi:thioredoxin reductase
MRVWDALVVGGGPGGLAAAFWLARYRRRTLVLDDARPRNEDAWAVHGFPGLDDLRPAELRRRLRKQATAAGALVERGRVVGLAGAKGAFAAADDRGETIRARRVVLAYGRADRIPEVAGLQEFYGTSVFHCPDCDGPSIAGGDVGVLGHDAAAAGLALYLLTWARRTVLLTHGLEPDLDADALQVLTRHDVTVEQAPVRKVAGRDGRVEAVDLANDRRLALDALFFHWGSWPASDLAERTGCEPEPNGDVAVNRQTMETSVPGVYAVGDIVGRPHLAITATAEGVRAALSIHRSLLPAEFQL